MYSDFFDFDEPSFHELYSMSTGVKKEALYFRVKINVQQGIHYMQVFEINRENLTKVIRNSTQFDIEIKSSTTKMEPPQVVKAGKSEYYGQCHPKTSGTKLLISRVSDDDRQLSIEVDIAEIKLEPQFFETPIQNTLLQVNTQFIGANTVLEVRTINKENMRSRRDLQNAPVQMIHFGINFFSLSIMRLRENLPRQELLNLVFSSISTGIEIKSGSEITFVGYIDNIQADNNSIQEAIIPVTIRKDPKLNPDILPPEETRLFQWHIVIENPLKSTHWYFSKLEAKVATIEALIEEEYVDTLLNFGRKVYESLSLEASTDMKECITRKYYRDFMEIHHRFDFSKRVWELSLLSPNNNSVYIEYMYISPLCVIMSYFQNSSSTFEKDFELVSLMGVMLGGFEEARIKIKELSGE